MRILYHNNLFGVYFMNILLPDFDQQNFCFPIEKFFAVFIFFTQSQSLILKDLGIKLKKKRQKILKFENAEKPVKIFKGRKKQFEKDGKLFEIQKRPETLLEFKKGWKKQLKFEKCRKKLLKI